MRPRDFLEWLSENTEDGLVTLSPGPFRVFTGVRDRIATKVLLWMQDEYPDLTIGDTEEILQTALWWVIFWAATHSE